MKPNLFILCLFFSALCTFTIVHCYCQAAKTTANKVALFKDVTIFTVSSLCLFLLSKLMLNIVSKDPGRLGNSDELHHCDLAEMNPEWD